MHGTHKRVALPKERKKERKINYAFPSATNLCGNSRFKELLDTYQIKNWDMACGEEWINAYNGRGQIYIEVCS